MPSHAQDQSTQTAASKGAQAQDTQLATNAAQNQSFANNSRSTLFGTYNPSTNTYTGGSQSAYLDPASQTTKDLSGTFLNQYNTQANTNAQAAKNAVSTTEQNMASRGMGATPAGFEADQQRKAYQDQAGQNGTDYGTAFGAQHNEAVNNYQNATNLLNSNANAAQNTSTASTTAAAGNYNGLYGTASTQVANPWATAGQTLAGMGQAAATAYAGR